MKTKPTKKTEHTPTPWHRNINANYPIYAGDTPNHQIVAFMDKQNPNAEENLRFIVRAVNSHAMLIDALAGFMRYTNGTDDTTMKLLRQFALDVIAQAESK